LLHLLSLIDYKDLTPPPLELPPRADEPYVRPPIEEADVRAPALL